MRIWIKDVTAVTMCERDAVLPHANLVIADNRIAYIGSAVPEGEFDRVIDGRGKVVMPGLINTHSHLAMTLLRSYADDMNLQDWLFQKIFPFEDTLTPEMIREGSEIGVQEMLQSGTTCFCDMYFFEAETANVAEAYGIRAVLCEGITDNVLDVKLEKTEVLLQQTADSPLIRIGISPHAVYTCSQETIRKCVDFAAEHDLMLHTHLSETETENTDCQRDYGMSPTQYMDACGLLTPRTVAAHGVWLSDADMQCLRARGVTIAHNPTSNLKLASGVAAIPELKRRGIAVSLGTDGASSNNNLDMFEEMKLAGILHKGVTRDPTVLPAWEILEMATVCGARALGYSDLGMLREGYLADLILLDFDAPHLKPNHNTIANLVYAAHGSDVCLTMVDGRIVYER